MFTGLSRNLGGLTKSESICVRLAISNSLTFSGYSAAVLFIASTIFSLTIFTTNSPFCSILDKLSFNFPSEVNLEEEKIINGGS